MIFKRKIKIAEVQPVTITEFVSEFCEKFSKTHYISVDVSANGNVHLFLNVMEGEKEDER